MILRGIVFLLLFAAVAPHQAALADGPVAESEVLAVEQQLSCPTCSNLRLDFCDLEICADMRAIIRERLEAGESPDQVIRYFTDRYGDRVLVAPPRDGIHLFAWLLPVIGGVAAVAGAWIVLRGWSRGRSAPAAAPAPLDARIERELAQFRDEGGPWS